MDRIIRLLRENWVITAAIVAGVWAAFTYYDNRRLTQMAFSLQEELANIQIGKPQLDAQSGAFQDIADIVSVRTQAIAAGKAPDDERWQKGFSH